jgi:hypothetical protein
MIKPRRVNLCVPLAALVCLLPGCVHVIHPAGIRPGWFAETALGRAREDLEKRTGAPADQPTSADVWDLQVNLGHRWRFSPNSGLAAELLVPLSAHDASPLGSLAATSLDLYWQFLGRPLDVGVGGVLGINGGVYLEAGKTLALGPARQIDLALGVMALGGYDVGAPELGGPLREFAVVNVREGRLSVGVWADHEDYPEPVGRCDESCDYEDYLEERWAAGAAVGWRIR